MRDPNRIPKIIKKLQAIWERTPDLRLGQIVENAKSASRHSGVDTFSIEDDVLEEGLDWLLERIE